MFTSSVQDIMIIKETEDRKMKNGVKDGKGGIRIYVKTMMVWQRGIIIQIFNPNIL